MSEKFDLTAFCGEDEGDCQLSAPIVRGGYSYATDGAIMVRIPIACSNNSPQGGMRFPDVVSKWSELTQLRDGTFVPLPEPSNSKRDFDSCLECDGYGIINRRNCAECDGNGGDGCPTCGHFYECYNCSGEGFIGETCPECEGEQQINMVAYHKFGTVWIRTKYLRILRSMDGIEIIVPVDPNQECIAFRCGELEGFSMGVNRERIAAFEN